MVNTEIRLITFFAAEDGEALYSQQKQPGTDCGSDHELLIVKFDLNLNFTVRDFTIRSFTMDKIH